MMPFMRSASDQYPHFTAMSTSVCPSTDLALSSCSSLPSTLASSVRSRNRSTCPNVTETWNGVSPSQSPHPRSAPACTMRDAASALPSWQKARSILLRDARRCFRIVVLIVFQGGFGGKVSSAGVFFSLSCMVTVASASSSISAILISCIPRVWCPLCPWHVTQCMGVQPKPSCPLTGAPIFSSLSTSFTWPFIAAACKRVVSRKRGMVL
mmetsp:Transcript_45809/g.104371  ORF Transcript_45809/g.104371 Transcript_45809/m.104371 type:complete len:210 (-) Transcript_45809:130-759(-)